MKFCGFWLDTYGPCPLPAVERLVHFNELCGGAGERDVCYRHLAEHLEEHLLAGPSLHPQNGPAAK